MQVRFGEFTVDTGSRQLWQGDTERHLSPKAFEFMCLLLINRPRALSKAELHERLWPSTFVSDAALSSLVAEVRAALGESAKAEGVVRTLHRFGYAFVGATSQSEERAPSTDDRLRCWVIWQWGRVGLKDGDHLLGRDEDVAVWLESATVSRHHARIRIRGLDATVEDLGSRNGTFLRGERLIAPASLNDGDEITVGEVQIRFRRVEPGAPTAPLP